MMVFNYPRARIYYFGSEGHDGLQNGEQALHKGAAPRRVERDEEDIKKMKEFFSVHA